MASRPRTKHPSLELIAALAVTIAFVASVLARFGGLPSPDIAAIYFGAFFYGNGQPEIAFWAQDLGPPDVWRDAAIAAGIAEDNLFAYLYPPIWLAVLAPLATSVSFSTFSLIFMAVNALAMMVTADALRRLLALNGPGSLWLLAAAAMSHLNFFAVSGFAFNQPQLIVTMLIVLGFERALAGRPQWAGACMAIAACIKIYPVLFGLFFLLRKDIKALTAFCLTGLAILVANFALTPLALQSSFLESASTISAHLSLTNNSLNISGLAARIYVLFDPHSWTEASLATDFTYIPKPTWVHLFNLAYLVVVFGGFVLFGRDQSAIWWRQRGALSMILLITVAMPVAWTNYYTIIFLAVPALFVLLSPRPATLFGFAVLGITSLAAFDLAAARQLLDPYNMTLVVLFQVFAVVLLGAPAAKGSRDGMVSER